ncbi:MAG: hypothetical protein K8F31_10580 [Roseovarius sp.]|nr:hypothetical protein [Roseovarius sp.]
MSTGNDWLKRPRHLIAGGVLSLALVLGTAVLSAWPDWQSVPEDHGVLRLSFAHSGVRNCRDRTEEELAALPRNMRNAQLCERRRAPVRIEMDIDGTTVYAADVSPTGLAGSGPSRMYERFELPAGDRRLTLRLQDDPSQSGYDYEAAFDISLAPGESIAVDFDAASGGFYIH